MVRCKRILHSEGVSCVSPSPALPLPPPPSPSPSLPVSLPQPCRPPRASSPSVRSCVGAWSSALPLPPSPFPLPPPHSPSLSPSPAGPHARPHRLWEAAPAPGARAGVRRRLRAALHQHRRLPADAVRDAQRRVLVRRPERGRDPRDASPLTEPPRLQPERWGSRPIPPSPPHHLSPHTSHIAAPPPTAAWEVRESPHTPPHTPTPPHPSPLVILLKFKKLLLFKQQPIFGLKFGMDQAFLLQNLAVE